MDIQSKIDAISSPLYQNYACKGFMPDPILGKRERSFSDICPDFFIGDKFLDIGCNKGYFIFKYRYNFGMIHGIDTDIKCISLCDDISSHLRSEGLDRNNVYCFMSGFKDFPYFHSYDRILVGNVAHFLYREADGWGWVEKLAELSSDRVIIEGPTGMDCEEMYTELPYRLHDGFNRQEFLAQLSKHFDVLKTEEVSTDRSLLLLRKINPDLH